MTKPVQVEPAIGEGQRCDAYFDGEHSAIFKLTDPAGHVGWSCGTHRDMLVHDLGEIPADMDIRGPWQTAVRAGWAVVYEAEADA